MRISDWSSDVCSSDLLGDIVFIELPAVGKRLEKGKEAAVVESVKAASEIYAPADGEVTAVNEALADEPGMANGDAEGNGWFRSEERRVGKERVGKCRSRWSVDHSKKKQKR